MGLFTSVVQPYVSFPILSFGRPVNISGQNQSNPLAAGTQLSRADVLLRAFVYNAWMHFLSCYVIAF